MYINLLQHSKIKIIASIKQDYNMEYLHNLAEEGVRIFRINGCIFNYKEYTILVEQINLIFKKIGEIPTIIYDLKGPHPTISKLGKNEKGISVSKGMTVKFIYEQYKSDENEKVIFLDKKIASVLKIGDSLIINGPKPNVILKVIGFEDCRKSLFSRQFSLNLLKNRKLSNGIEEIQTEEKLKHFNTNSFCPHHHHHHGKNNQSDSNLTTDLEHNQTYEKLLRTFCEKPDDYENLNQMDTQELGCTSEIQNQNQNFKNTNNVVSAKHKNIHQRRSSSPQKNSKTTIVCEVQNEGLVVCKSKVSLLDRNLISELDEPIIGAKDITDISKIVSLGINFITTLVDSPKHIDEILDLLDEENKQNFKILAKIETLDGFYNFNKILERCDGVIICKGLLLYKLPLVELSSMENFIIDQCKLNKKILLLQTDFDENLILDFSTIEYAVQKGFDGLIIKEEDLLCGKSDSENTPKKLSIIKTIKETIIQFESNFQISKTNLITKNFFDLLFENVAKTSHELKTKIIILYTDDYEKVRDLSNFRPYSLIVYPINKEIGVQFTNLISGIIPYFSKEVEPESYHHLINEVKSKVKMKPDDKVIVVNAYKDMLKFKNGMYVI